MNVFYLDIGIWMCVVNDVAIEMLKSHDLQIRCVEQISFFSLFLRFEQLPDLHGLFLD